MRRSRTALRSGDAVVVAADPDAAALTGCPHLADDADRLLERTDCLPGRQPPAAIRLDRVPERASAEAKLDPPAAEQIQAGGATGEDVGRAQRQVDHVRRQPDPGRGGGDKGQQGPRIKETWIVGVILDGDQVKSGLLGEPRERHHPVRRSGGRRDEAAQEQLVPVVGHLCRSAPRIWVRGR